MSSYRVPNKQFSNARKRNGRRRSQRSDRGPSGFGSSTGRGAASRGASATTASTGLVLRNLPLFAMRTKRTLQYYAEVQVTGTVSSAAAYVFSANGVYDPDITGTGTQPMGFDQMMSFYNHYTVVRSRITAILSNTNTAELVSTGVLISGSSTVNTNIEDMVENGDVALATLTFYGQMGCIAKVSKTCVAARFQGIDDVMDDSQMRGDAASNPAEQMYFHIVAYNPYSSTAVNVKAQVVIEYDVMFHEPRKGPLS